MHPRAGFVIFIPMAPGKPEARNRGRSAVNPQKKSTSNITIAVTFYVIAAVWLYDLKANLPALIQLFTEYFTIPLRYMFRPFYPLMKPFGWVVADGADLPTAYGIVAGTAAWIFFLIFVAWVFTPKPDKKRKHEEYWGG